MTVRSLRLRLASDALPANLMLLSLLRLRRTPMMCLNADLLVTMVLSCVVCRCGSTCRCVSSHLLENYVR